MRISDWSSDVCSSDLLGGRELKPSTLMMGHGYDPVLSEGALKPPIFLTSTFVFESAEAGKRHFEGITGKRAGGAEGLVYSRRSEERRVGKEGGSPCRSRWSPDREKKKIKKKKL